MKTIVKSELIDETWKKLNGKVEKNNVDSIIKTFIKIVGREIKEGNIVKIEGLGKFCPYYKTYVGKDISTGKERKFENEKHIRFVPSSKLKT